MTNHQRRKVKGKRHEKARIKQWRLPLLIAATAGLLIVLAASVPIRVTHVPQSVARILAEQFDLKMSVESAHVWLFPPTVEVQQARLSAASEDDSRPALAVAHGELVVNPLWWIFGAGNPVSSLVIESPSPLQFRLTEEGLAPPPELRPLLEQASKRATKTASGSPGLSRLEIRNMQLAVMRHLGAGLDLPVRPKKTSYETTAVVLQVNSFRLKETGGNRYTVACAGDIAVQQAPSSFEVRGVLLGTNEFAGELRAPVVRGGWPLGFRGSASAEARELRVDTRILRQDQRLELLADATVGALAVAVPQHGVAYQDENLRVSIRSNLSLTESAWTVEDVTLKSPQIDVQVSGEAGWEKGLRYYATINAPQIGGPYIELLNAPLPKGFDLTAAEGKLQASVHVRGKGQQLESVIGQLSFSTVTLQTPHFRRPLRELGGEVDFEPDRVVFRDLSAKLARTWLTLNGELRGDYLTSRTGTLRMDWQSRADAKDLAELVRTASGPTATEIPVIINRGTVLSQGRLEQIITEDPAQWQTPHIEGQVVLRDVEIRHHSLRVPLSDIGGELRIENSKVLMDSLGAKVGNNTITVKGEMVGERYFWRDPVVSATAMLSADAASLRQILEPSLGERLAPYKLGGHVGLKLLCAVPISQPEKSEITGKAEIRGGSFEVTNEQVAVKVANADANLEWDGKNLRISRLSGVANGVRLSASGTADFSKIRLQVQAEGELEDLQSALPRTTPYVELRGPARCEANLVIDEPVPMAEKRSFVQMLTSLSTRLQQAYAKGHISAQGEIVAGTSDAGAVFRHHAMPPARSLYYGISVPRAEIADIRGTLSLKGNSIEVPEASPLKCAMADTPQCRLSGKIDFVPGHYPKVSFKVVTAEEAKLDTWLTGWSEGFQPPPRSTSPPKGKRFDLEGTIVAPRATYKGEKVGETSGRILYTYVAGEPPYKTEFRDVVINGFGGTMRGHGLIESWRQKPDDYPRWEANVALDQVQIPPLSRWVFRDPRLVEGRISGRMRLQGVKTDVKRLRGSGSAMLREVEVGRLPFVLKLFQMLNLTQTRGLFEKAAYNSKREARFTIADGVVSCEKVELETEGLLLEVFGQYFLDDHRIDAQVRLNLFESSLLGALPLVGDLARMADKTLGKAIMAFRVSGQAAQPNITPIPLPMFQNALPGRL